MQAIEIVSEPGRASTDLVRILSEHFIVQQLGIGMIRSRRPGQVTIFDIAVRDSMRVAVLKSWLAGRPAHAKTLIVLDAMDPSEFARAQSTGVERVMARPIERSHLLNYLLGAPTTCNGAHRERIPLQATVSQGVGTLSAMFSSVRSGQPLDADLVCKAGNAIVQEIGHSGLSDWVETVRKHHDRTYQHCLLVTGVGVAFARHLGFSPEDQARISFAGMIHDLGKAKVPLEILEKPGALDETEWRVMRAHPQNGIEALAGRSDISASVLDVVLHHHEYLDGSGYPDGLRGREISDIVRMMTIADIFGALLERRSYKPPISSQTAYWILLDMGQKLDRDMVREFAAVAMEKASADELTSHHSLTPEAAG